MSALLRYLPGMILVGLSIILTEYSVTYLGLEPARASETYFLIFIAGVSWIAVANL